MALEPESLERPDEERGPWVRSDIARAHLTNVVCMSECWDTKKNSSQMEAQLEKEYLSTSIQQRVIISAERQVPTSSAFLLAPLFLTVSTIILVGRLSGRMACHSHHSWHP